MPTVLIDHKSWLSQTSVPGNPRSQSLKKLDDAIKAYEANPTGGTHAVQAALTAWKQQQGAGEAWKRSLRNRNKAVEHLELMLAGKASDQLLNNVSDGIADDLAHSRLGVLYLFSNITIGESGLGEMLGEFATAVGSGVGIGVKDPIDKLSGFGKTAAEKGLQVGQKGLTAGAKFAGGKLDDKLSTANTPAAPKTTLKQDLVKLYDDFVVKIKKMLAERFGNVDIGPYVLTLVTTVATKISEQFGGVISAIADTTQGAAIALDNLVGRIKTWLLQKEVKLMNGFPKAVVDGVNRAMSLAAFEGLAQAAKGAINLGVGIGASAASPIVSAVLDGAQAIFKAIWRICEKIRLVKFITQAAEHYRSRDDDGALHKSPLAFAAWYRSHALTVPLIAALTLNSGICGAKVHYLQLFQTDGSVVSQNEFDKGVKLLDNLKPRCGEFIRNTPHKLASSDGFVSQLLTRHMTDPADTRNALFAIVRGQKKLTINNLKQGVQQSMQSMQG